MTKSELIDRMVNAQAKGTGLQLTNKDVELAVKTMLEQMSGTLASGGRIEVRGFGSFSLHYRAPRIAVTLKPVNQWVCLASMCPTSNPAKNCVIASMRPWNAAKRIMRIPNHVLCRIVP